MNKTKKEYASPVVVVFATEATSVICNSFISPDAANEGIDTLDPFVW